MRLIIVDDSNERIELIKKALEDSSFAMYLDVIYCDSADSARRELISACDLLLLDVLIPKKSNGTPQAIHSINLLNDICNPRKNFIRPRLIVGLTADLEELGVYQEQFAIQASVVLRGELKSIDWLDSLLAQIQSLISSDMKAMQKSKDRVLISVHGIRTYGQWQKNLTEEISKVSRSFECIEIKYGFFDLISFLMPYFRRKAIERIGKRIVSNIDKFAHCDIYIVAHSFGTVLVSGALKVKQPAKPLKGVIFCGSPLSQNYDIDHVVNFSEMMLNDCGTKDKVLIFARILVLGLGDAGRVGFLRENTSKFCNRYFNGGHSLYFNKFDDGVEFYKNYWLRFIAFEEKPERIDLRKNYIGEDVVDLSIKLLTLIKPIFYCLFLLFLIVLPIFRWYL